LGVWWALEWALHIAEANLRCVRSSGICMPNLNSCVRSSGICTPNLNSLAYSFRELSVHPDRRTWLDRRSEISAFIRKDRQTDMARSIRLVILIKNLSVHPDRQTDRRTDGLGQTDGQTDMARSTRLVGTDRRT